MKRFFIILLIAVPLAVKTKCPDFSDYVDPNYDYSCTACGYEPLSKVTEAATSYSDVIIIAVDPSSYAQSLLPSNFDEKMSKLNDYFNQNSFGRCNYQYVILKKDPSHAFIMPELYVPPYTSDCWHVHSYSNMINVLEQADNIYNFTNFDSNHDNKVTIHFSSIGNNGGGYVGECVHYISNDTGTGGVKVEVIVNRQSRGSNLDNYFTVVCHELGHALFGFPDMASYPHDHYGAGGFDVMSSCYGFQRVPSLSNPFFRNVRNWYTPTEITSDLPGALLQDFQTNQKSYVYNPSSWPSDAFSDQRFYISYHYYDPFQPEINQYYSTWPYKIPEKGGILIWHSRGLSCGSSYMDWRRLPLDIECAHGKTNWNTTVIPYVQTGENPLTGRDKLEIRRIVDGNEVEGGPYYNKDVGDGTVFFTPDDGKEFTFYSNPNSNWTNKNLSQNYAQNITSGFSVKNIRTQNGSVYADFKINDFNITKNTALRAGTWLIGDNITITISSGAVLTIDPGVTIKFGKDCQIVVESGSKILANGTQANPIIFTSMSGTLVNPWKYIQVKGGDSIFKYCTFEYSIYPLYLYNAKSGAAIIIENCIFRNNSNYGLRIYNSNANVKNCEMTTNGYYGIHCQSTSTVKLTGNRIHHNSRIGIYTLSSPQLKLYGNVIEYNGGTDLSLHGIYASNAAVVLLGIPYTWNGKNTIRYNGGSEIYAYSGNPDVDACYSSIHDVSGTEIYNYAGNQNVYTLSCYYETNGLQYTGAVTNDSPNNSHADWDGQTYDNFIIPKMGMQESLLAEGGRKDDEKRMRELKDEIVSSPESDEAVAKLTELFFLVRNDYAENLLNEKETFGDYLENIRSFWPDKNVGKSALRYLILWRMLEDDIQEVVKLSMPALKKLQEPERMYVLLDLGFTYVHAGYTKEAETCLSKFEKEYASEKEFIRLLHNDIEDINNQQTQGLFIQKEYIDLPSISGFSDQNEDATITLMPGYPNPGNPFTTIRFMIPLKSHVSLKIVNILGQEVKSLIEEHREAGIYEIVWDLKDNNKVALPSGTYLAVLESCGFMKTEKITLLK